MEATGTVPQVGQLKLVPVLPSLNPRYDRNITRQTQLNGFREFVHPEGDIYYVDQSRRVITASDPGHPPWSRTLDGAYKQVVRLLGRTTRLPASSELWLSSQQASPLEVGYYLVNHDERVIYWPEEVDVRRLGLGPFESNVDLRGAMASEYWVHIDYYPGQRDVDGQAEEELIATLRYGCIDDMTAPGSTFPWSAEECRQFLIILEGFQSISSKNTLAARTSCIARLWAAISRARHIHGYGTQNARLDRFQGLEGSLSQQVTWSLPLALGEAVALGYSRHLFRRMTELWNGRVMYQRHWETFLGDMRREWMQMTYFVSHGFPPR
ncbi:hypothetical protein FRC04_008610 [Tulasnella sp. 424]|nr:hypothetical protein FRC04_008610 [Tulasnella sp. 424]